MNKSRPSKRHAPPATGVSLVSLANDASDAAALLKALANADRLQLLCHLVEDERNVSALEALTGIHQPTLSQQLGVLRDEGLVETRREGKFIFYRIASGAALTVLRTLCDIFCRPVAPSRSGRVLPRRRSNIDEHRLLALRPWASLVFHFFSAWSQRLRGGSRQVGARCRLHAGGVFRPRNAGQHVVAIPRLAVCAELMTHRSGSSC